MTHVCGICGNGFRNRSGLKRHTRVHITEQRANNNDNSMRTLICNLCSEKFENDKEYENHIQNVHSKVPRVLKCTHCGCFRPLAENFDINLPFKCESCLIALNLLDNKTDDEIENDVMLPINNTIDFNSDDFDLLQPQEQQQQQQQSSNNNSNDFDNNSVFFDAEDGNGNGNDDDDDDDDDNNCGGPGDGGSIASDRSSSSTNSSGSDTENSICDTKSNSSIQATDKTDENDNVNNDKTDDEDDDDNDDDDDAADDDDHHVQSNDENMEEYKMKSVDDLDSLSGKPGSLKFRIKYPKKLRENTLMKNNDLNHNNGGKRVERKCRATSKLSTFISELSQTRTPLTKRTKRRTKTKHLLPTSSVQSIITSPTSPMLTPIAFATTTMDTTKAGVSTTPTDSTKKRFQCFECNKTFKHYSSLNLHQKCHSDIQHFQYKCEYCDKEFYISDYFKKHLRVHTKEKPYVCDDCGKAFSQSNTLTQHKRIHSGEKPYKCTVCNKLFMVKDYLNKHLRTHTGERPYECTVCTKRYKQSNSLRAHQKTHINTDVF